jgi:hypothetical protein
VHPVALETVRQRLEDSGRRQDKLLVKIDEALESLQLLDRGWPGEFADCLYVVRERGHARGGHLMAEKNN